MRKLMMVAAAALMLGAAPALADKAEQDENQARAAAARAERDRARESGHFISVPGYGWMYVGPGRQFTTRNQGRDIGRNHCACSKGGSYSHGKTGGDMGY